ncbi:MAG: RibD family protein [Candidatus Bathyarchaeota archaeon]|nr:RibD family protein [Candidatus Bathyarchaeota archaeon]
MTNVIIHNSISLDGSLVNFIPNMELHYSIAAKFKPDAHLVGSNTVKVGIQMFQKEIPAEEDRDFVKPNRESALVYWVIPDSNGALKGLLHVCRRFDYCKDVIVLVSEKTPDDYLSYLTERHYDYFVVGKDHVDLKTSLEVLAEKYAITTVLTDAGRILTNLLLQQGLVSEVSLLIHPVIVGKEPYRVFDQIEGSYALALKNSVPLENNFVWLTYTVKAGDEK